MRNSGSSVRLLRGNHGRINPDEIVLNINPDDQHYPVTKMVSIEDTSNRGGGVVYDFNDIKKISSISKELGLKFHLDGARVFNALEVTKINPKEYGSYFDSISVCLSKSLGAPVGSLLLHLPVDNIRLLQFDLFAYLMNKIIPPLCQIFQRLIFLIHLPSDRHRKRHLLLLHCT